MPDRADGKRGDGAGRSDIPPPSPGGTGSPLILAILLAIVGLGSLSLAVSGPHTGLVQTIYRGIGLLDHDSGWAFEDKTGTSSWTFKVLAVVAPLFTAATVVYIITDWLQPTVVRLRALGWLVFRKSRGVALIGLNESSFELACALQAVTDEDGCRFIPLIFTENRTGALATRCQRQGIALYPRHEHDARSINRSGRSGGTRALNRHADRTRDLISFLPAAEAQIDFLIELQGWRAREGSHRARAWVLLEDRGLSQRLDQLSRLPSQAVMPRLVTLDMLAARQLMLAHQFDVLADAFCQARIHLVIYGMGQAGRAIIKEAAQLYVTLPFLKLPEEQAKLRITAFDQDGEAVRSALFAEDPGLASVVALEVRTMDIPKAGLPESQVCQLPQDVTGHIVAFEDPGQCFNLAISLRRWLLEPPGGKDGAPPTPVHAAPIFVRIANLHGVGRLFEKPAVHPPTAFAAPDSSLKYPPPDGLFGFGAIETIFGAPHQAWSRNGTVLDDHSEQGARAIHAAYCRTRTRSTVALGPNEARTAEADWQTLSPQLRESNFRAYDHLAIKARAAGCRLVPGKTAIPADLSALHAHAADLSRLEHLRYKAERLANGWRYAARRLDAVGVHPDLVDWSRLDSAEQALDQAQIDALPDVANAAKHYLATALLIGVAGHCPDAITVLEVESVKLRLGEQLRELCKRNAGAAPLLLTALAPGVQSWAAQLASELQIPYLALLPLPYEILREDFPEAADLEQFHRLAAGAEQCIELPMRFGRASELTRNPQPPATDNLAKRAQQCALASAYIVQRAQSLLVVSDGNLSEYIGGSLDVLEWWTKGVPSGYDFALRFFPKPQRRSAALIIDPGGTTVSYGDSPAPDADQR